MYNLRKRARTSEKNEITTNIETSLPITSSKAVTKSTNSRNQRKRAKTTHFVEKPPQNAVTSIAKTKKPGLFDYIPTEICYIIFKNLSTNDLRSLRLVNNRLKEVVDSYRPLWKKLRLRTDDYPDVRILLNSNNKYKNKTTNTIQLVRDFLNRIPDINDIELKCDDEITTELECSNKCSNNDRVIESNGRNDRLFKLVRLHTKLVLPYLSLIAKCCNRLKISSFYEHGYKEFKKSRSSLETIQSTSAPVTSNQQLVEMKHVKCLNISFQIHNSKNYITLGKNRFFYCFN